MTALGDPAVTRVEVDADDLREVLDEIVRCGSTAAGSPAGQAHARLRAALPPEQISAEEAILQHATSTQTSDILAVLDMHGYRIVRKDDGQQLFIDPDWLGRPLARSIHCKPHERSNGCYVDPPCVPCDREGNPL